MRFFPAIVALFLLLEWAMFNKAVPDATEAQKMEWSQHLTATHSAAIAILAALALYQIWVFKGRPKDESPLYLSGMLVSAAAHFIWEWNMTGLTAEKFNPVFLSLLFAFSALFYKTAFRYRATVLYLPSAVAIAVNIYAIFVLNKQHAIYLSLTALWLSVLTAAVFLSAAILFKKKDATAYSLALFFLLPAALIDHAAARGLLSIPLVFPYLLFYYLLLHSLTLSRNLAARQAEFESLGQFHNHSSQILVADKKYSLNLGARESDSVQEIANAVSLKAVISAFADKNARSPEAWLAAVQEGIARANLESSFWIGLSDNATGNLYFTSQNVRDPTLLRGKEKILLQPQNFAHPHKAIFAVPLQKGDALLLHSQSKNSISIFPENAIPLPPVTRAELLSLRSLVRDKKFSEAAQKTGELLERGETDSLFLLFAAKVFRHAGEQQKALLLAEKLYLREGQNAEVRKEWLRAKKLLSK